MKIENSMLHTLLSWFAYMAKDEIENKESATYLCIKSINNYYDKRHKKIIVNSYIENYANKKLKQVQKFYEDLISLKDENGNLIVNENGDISTISYSTTVYALLALDYMINVERDTSIRTHLGHFNTREFLTAIEDQHKDLFYDSIKIYNKLIDFMKG